MIISHVPECSAEARTADCCSLSLPQSHTHSSLATHAPGGLAAWGLRLALGHSAHRTVSSHHSHHTPHDHAALWASCELRPGVCVESLLDTLSSRKCAGRRRRPGPHRTPYCILTPLTPNTTRPRCAGRPACPCGSMECVDSAQSLRRTF